MFSSVLLKWYKEHKRALPWRGQRNPYYIWLSEVILQQTRIAQGTDYYLRFIERFPTVEDLAAASEDEVMKLWEGLGYYSRARNLHFAARQIVAQGGFPTTYEGVKTLKGVGEYTAAAICSMAYGLPVATLDGNAYRVLGRIYQVDEPFDTTQGKAYYRELVQSLLDRKYPGEFNQAVMDFGAMQCVPQHPDCMACPFSDQCGAYTLGKVQNYPVRAKKPTIKERYLHYFYCLYDSKVLIHKRSGKDIWKSLYEPYLIETRTSASPFELKNEWLQQIMPQAVLQPLYLDVKHVLTHRVLWMQFYVLKLKQKPQELPSDYDFVSLEQLHQLALPIVVKKHLPLF